MDSVILHLTEVMYDARRAADMGVAFGQLRIDVAALRRWKNQVIDRLADGLVYLSDKRGVQLVQARAVFEGSDRLRLGRSEMTHLRFCRAILAAGSQPIPLPGTDLKPGSRIMDSTAALELEAVPHTLLVVGGGYVGLESGMVYASLGCQVSPPSAESARPAQRRRPAGQDQPHQRR